MRKKGRCIGNGTYLDVGRRHAASDGSVHSRVDLQKREVEDLVRKSSCCSIKLFVTNARTRQLNSVGQSRSATPFADSYQNPIS